MIPSREEFARRCAEAWWNLTDSAAIALAITRLDQLARAGIEVVMGYDHTNCATCRGQEFVSRNAPGAANPVPCPAGTPLYWEAP